VNNQIILFFFATILTIGTTWTILNIVGKKRREVFNNLQYRQSDIHEIIKNHVPRQNADNKIPISQSRNHIQKNMVKVVMVEDKAYWVMDNVFYVAKTVNGRIDPATTEPLDIINMPEKELKVMLDILDSLKMGSGSNDSGSSRNE